MSRPTPEIEAPDHEQALLAPPPGTEPPPPKPETPKPEQPGTEKATKAPRRHWWIYAALMILLTLALFWWRGDHKAAPASQKAGSGKGGRGGAPAVTPVVAAQAETGNIGVYVTGLGAI